MGVEQKCMCVVCGREFTHRTENYGRPRLYCSVECRNARPKRGKTISIVKCRCCGKDFVRNGESVRECCSAACSIAEIHRQAAHYRNNGSDCKAFRDWVVSLCLNGYGYYRTADALGLNRWTVLSWTARSKGRKGSHKSRRYFSYPSAQSADEWIEILRAEVTLPDSTTETMIGSRRVFIACDPVHILKGTDQLTAIIASRLQMDPFDGSIYGFCGYNHESVRYLFWDGAEFSVVTRRREQGTYPWPSPLLGAVMQLSPQDFELILRGRINIRDNRRLDWDSINLSGMETSE